MIYYAIQQKSTGFYLSLRKGKGKTWDEPCDPKVKPPRLFVNKQAAVQALNWWLQGGWEWKYSPSTWLQPEDHYIDNTFFPHRKPEDMEIVEVYCMKLMHPVGKVYSL